eukprot:6201962-Pleurochrysis_carterae.AAC.2
MGEVWGDRPIALVYVDVPGNAAKVLAYLKLAFPVDDETRPFCPSRHPRTARTPLSERVG